MKRHWDEILASVGLLLGVVAMAGSVMTGDYAHAAGAEARGVDALMQVVTELHCGAAATSTLVASNEAGQ